MRKLTCHSVRAFKRGNTPLICSGLIDTITFQRMSRQGAFETRRRGRRRRRNAQKSLAFNYQFAADDLLQDAIPYGTVLRTGLLHAPWPLAPTARTRTQTLWPDCRSVLSEHQLFVLTCLSFQASVNGV